MWPFKKRPKKADEPAPVVTPSKQSDPEPAVQVAPPVVPPVNLNEAVTNPGLVDAIAAFNAAPSHDADRAVMLEISRANFLAAAVIAPENIDQSATPGQMTIKSGGQIAILSCTDPNGLKLLPLFTDWPAIAAFTDQKVSGLVMPADHAWKLAANGYGGVIINPAGERVKLTLEAIQKVFINDPTLGNVVSVPNAPNTVNTILTESIQLQVRLARQVPIEVANKLKDYCESHPAIKSCILLDARKPDSDESDLKLLINLGLIDGTDFSAIADELLMQIKDFPEVVSKAMVVSDGQYERYLPDALYVQA